MFPVELSERFLDVSMQFFGCVLARFVDLSVIEKGHAFFNILALIHDYQGYSLVCCKYHSRGVFPEGLDGLLLFGDVASRPLLVLEVFTSLVFW